MNYHLHSGERNDIKTRVWLRTETLTTPALQQDYFERVDRDPTVLWRYIKGEEKEDIGIFGLTSINNESAEFSILVYKEHRKQGYGKSMLESLLDYGFNHLGLNEIYGETYGYEVAAKEWFDDLGVSYIEENGILWNPALHAFKKIGFSISKEQNKLKKYGYDVIGQKVVMTRKMYKARNNAV
jgi:RimJ/RimL family protein N-acetyltransferase